MSTHNNIFKIDDKNLLKSFLEQYGSKNYIMLAIIIKGTLTEIKNMIYLYMKKKAETNPNYYFLIYLVDEQNINNISKIFPNEKTSYPYVIYIYDKTVKLLDVDHVTTLKPLNESFNILDSYIKNIDDEEYDIKIDDNNSKINSQQNYNIEDNTNENIESMDNECLINNKKLADKILLLMDFKKDNDKIFIQDIARRKKMEKKIEDEKKIKDEKKTQAVSNRRKK